MVGAGMHPSEPRGMQMFGQIGKLTKDARGATAIEYGLLLALIGMGMSAGLSELGGANGRGWAAMVADVTGSLL
jgi:Flp pilus assembly pilin Flp